MPQQRRLRRPGPQVRRADPTFVMFSATPLNQQQGHRGKGLYDMPSATNLTELSLRAGPQATMVVQRRCIAQHTVLQAEQWQQHPMDCKDIHLYCPMRLASLCGYKLTQAMPCLSSPLHRVAHNFASFAVAAAAHDFDANQVALMCEPVPCSVYKLPRPYRHCSAPQHCVASSCSAC